MTRQFFFHFLFPINRLVDHIIYEKKKKMLIFQHGWHWFYFSFQFSPFINHWQELRRWIVDIVRCKPSEREKRNFLTNFTWQISYARFELQKRVLLREGQFIYLFSCSSTLFDWTFNVLKRIVKMHSQNDYFFLPFFPLIHKFLWRKSRQP